MTGPRPLINLTFRKYSTHYGLVRLQAAVERMPLENILLSKLTTAIVQTAFDEFQKTRSYGYANSVLGLIRQTLKYSYRMGFIADIRFIANVQLHKPLTNVDKVKKNRAKFLTKAELKELMTKKIMLLI